MLEENQPLRLLEMDAEDEKRIRGFQFLSQKPMLYVLNLGEEDAGKLHEREQEYRKGPLAGRRNTAARRDLRQDRSRAGRTAARGSSRNTWPATDLKESGLERLISATYSLLGLMSFLTAGEDEVPRLDHPDEQHRGEGRRRDPLAISRRSSSAPKW